MIFNKVHLAYISTESRAFVTVLTVSALDVNKQAKSCLQTKRV